MTPRAALALALLLSGCPTVAPPGEPMGQYALTATPVEREACELEEISGAEFSFQAVLSGDRDGGRGWVTLNGYTREGTWDGQVLTSEASASRVFVACGGCATRLVETLSVALLSRSQSDAVQSQCPPNPLDGGVPAPNPDAGLFPPAQSMSGFDSVLVCGELVTYVVAEVEEDGGACDPRCSGCRVRYQLRGDRR